MLIHKNVVQLCATFLIVLFSQCAWAQQNKEVSSDEQNNAYSFFELGAAINTFTPLFLFGESSERELQLILRYGRRWDNGFFINFGNFGTRGNGVGYNFYQSDDWEFDALIHLGHDAIEIGNRVNETDFRIGLRATRYFDNDSVFRFIASPLSVTLEKDGFYAASWYAKNWQIKNWNIHGIAGASYFSADILNNFYGVTSFQDGERVYIYEAGQGLVLEFEIGASYALSQDWIFEASIGQTITSDAIFDSPIVENRGQTYASVGFVYVF